MEPRALQLNERQRAHLQACMASTGDLVELLLEIAVHARVAKRRADALELAVSFAQQGLRAARMLSLY